MRILLIENDPALLKAMGRLCHRWFSEPDVWEARSGEVAVAFLERASVDFDVIISDYDLDAALTGGDVLAWIYAHRPTLVNRFVFFTGNDRAGQIHDRVLMKPAPVADLRTWIGTVIGR